MIENLHTFLRQLGNEVEVPKSTAQRIPNSSKTLCFLIFCIWVYLKKEVYCTFHNMVKHEGAIVQDIEEMAR